MRVHIAQLKCPNNHCVLAAAGEFDSDEAAAVLAYRLGAKMAELVEAHVLKYECGICLSTNLHVQVERTGFATLEEARPFLKASEEAQAASRAMLKHARN